MKHALLAIFALVLLAATPLQHRSDHFQGKWDIEAMPDSGGKSFRAVLAFQPDKFSVQSPILQGFKPVTYDVDTRGVTTNSFSATIQKDTGKEKMTWTGVTPTGQDIKGEVKWTKANGDEVSYSYSGTKK